MKHLALAALLGLAAAASTNTYRVPVEIHIMSQCPDAADCFLDLVAPTLARVPDITAFTLSFIGARTPAGVACMHGPHECLGNMLHLCGARLSTPPAPPPPARYAGFSACLLRDYARVADEAFVRGCAAQGLAGARFDDVNACVSDLGEHGGLRLLEDSVARSAAAGVRRSCTVRVEGRTVCVRDGGEWKDCPGGSGVDDLVRAIEEAHERGGVLGAGEL